MFEHQIAYEIVLTHRHPTAGEDEIGIRRCFVQRRSQGMGGVMHGILHDRFMAHSTDEANEAVGIRFVDLTREEIMSRRFQLVSGRDDRHSKPS